MQSTTEPNWTRFNNSSLTHRWQASEDRTVFSVMPRRADQRRQRRWSSMLRFQHAKAVLWTIFLTFATAACPRTCSDCGVGERRGIPHQGQTAIL